MPNDIKTILEGLKSEILLINIKKIVFFLSATLFCGFVEVILSRIFINIKNIAYTIVFSIIFYITTYYLIQYLRSKIIGNNFSVKIIKKVLENLDINLQHYENESIKESDYIDSNLFYDRSNRSFSGSNLISMVNENFTTLFSNIKATYQTSGKNRSTITEFKGLFFCNFIETAFPLSTGKLVSIKNDPKDILISIFKTLILIILLFYFFSPLINILQKLYFTQNNSSIFLQIFLAIIPYWFIMFLENIFISNNRPSFKIDKNRVFGNDNDKYFKLESEIDVTIFDRFIIAKLEDFIDLRKIKIAISVKGERIYTAFSLNRNLLEDTLKPKGIKTLVKDADFLKECVSINEAIVKSVLKTRLPK